MASHGKESTLHKLAVGSLGGDPANLNLSKRQEEKYKGKNVGKKEDAGGRPLSWREGC